MKGSSLCQGCPQSSRLAGQVVSSLSPQLCKQRLNHQMGVTLEGTFEVPLSQGKRKPPLTRLLHGLCFVRRVLLSPPSILWGRCH